MVKARSKELVKMTFLDEALSSVSSMEGIDAEESQIFKVDGKYSHFFEVLSGSCLIATTWRELPSSDEVTGLMSLKAGDGALILPGEPYLLKIASESEVSEFVLGNYVQ